MIPLINAVSAATSLLGGLANVFAPRPTNGKSGASEFAKHLASQLKEQEELKRKDPTSSIQSMLALQQSRGSLRIEQQVLLGRLLLHQNVQVIDSSGNSHVGTVSNVRLQDGTVQLTIDGQSYPISAVKAVLQGVPARN